MWVDKSWKASVFQISPLLPSSLPWAHWCAQSHTPKSFTECLRCNYPLILHKINRSRITTGILRMLQFVSESLLNHQTYYLKLLKCLKSMWLHRRLGARERWGVSGRFKQKGENQKKRWLFRGHHSRSGLSLHGYRTLPSSYRAYHQKKYYFTNILGHLAKLWTWGNNSHIEVNEVDKVLPLWPL